MKTTVERFIMLFDKALPGKKHTTIYSGRTKKYSQILYQLRTGICRLNSISSKKIQAVESDQCRCNRGRETVDHFFVLLPNAGVTFAKEFKKTSKSLLGCDLSKALGGWSSERKDGAFG